MAVDIVFRVLLLSLVLSVPMTHFSTSNLINLKKCTEFVDNSQLLTIKWFIISHYFLHPMKVVCFESHLMLKRYLKNLQK